MSEFIPLTPSSKRQSLSRYKVPHMGWPVSFFIYVSHNNQSNMLSITKEAVSPNLDLFFDSQIPIAPTTGRTMAMWMYVQVMGLFWCLHPTPSVVFCDSGH